MSIDSGSFYTHSATSTQQQLRITSLAFFWRQYAETKWRARISKRRQGGIYVPDEMHNFQDGRCGVQSLLNLTKSLTRTAAYSTTREMEGNSTLRAEKSVSRRPSRRQALISSLPGHHYRPTQNETANKPTAIPRILHLIEVKSLEEKNEQDGDSEQQAEITFHESMVVLKGEFDLIPGQTKDQIRNELVDVFKTKFPFTGKHIDLFAHQLYNISDSSFQSPPRPISLLCTRRTVTHA